MMHPLEAWEYSVSLEICVHVYWSTFAIPTPALSVNTQLCFRWIDIFHNDNVHVNLNRLYVVVDKFLICHWKVHISVHRSKGTRNGGKSYFHMT
mmetsp:Transcript_24986/g.34958  ORF Transcript_24986/g.34958 Transcript_24986/m.34958 type:complete len:94 (+) Transcript_24986:562-843(+)